MVKAKLDLHFLRKVIDDVASAHTAEQQINLLVGHIRTALRANSCSLYQIQERAPPTCIATDPVSNSAVTLATQAEAERLAFEAATTALPQHLMSEKGLVMLAVPVTNLGAVVGIILVLRNGNRAFSANEESFLVTVVAQLSGILLSIPRLEDATHPRADRRLHGISGAPGKAIGTLQLVLTHQTLQYLEPPQSQGPDAESALLERAIARTQQTILDAKSRFSTELPDDVLSVFDFYREILTGELPSLARAGIARGESAFGAVRMVIDQQVKAFEAIEDEYLRARGEDIRHIGTQVLTALIGSSESEMPKAKDMVLLGDLISVADIGQFDPSQIAGIICLQGSALSHTAILAKALGIPTVVGIGPIDHISNGETVVVDGDSGSVVLNPSPALLRVYRSAIEDAKTLLNDLLELNDLPAVTTDGEHVKLLANTGLQADFKPGLAHGAEGVGLFRSEIPFLIHSAFPTEQEQCEIYTQLLTTYHPKPVTIRTLDVGGDKQLPYMPIDELNPSLGWRGIRFALDNPAVLATQLRAMLRANQGLGNLRIMLPMVSDVSDVDLTHRLLQNLADELSTTSGSTLPPLGIMIEIPGIVPLLPHLANYLQFVSVGTNDLTQYLLAVDRGNQRVSARFQTLHPGVLHALKDIVTTSRGLDLEISMCGEMAADPVAAVLLVGMGVDSLSMSAFSLPKIRALIRHLSFRDAAMLLERALTMQDAGSIRSMLEAELNRLDLQHLWKGADPALVS